LVANSTPTLPCRRGDCAGLICSGRATTTPCSIDPGMEGVGLAGRRSAAASMTPLPPPRGAKTGSIYSRSARTGICCTSTSAPARNFVDHASDLEVPNSQGRIQAGPNSGRADFTGRFRRGRGEAGLTRNRRSAQGMGPSRAGKHGGRCVGPIPGSPKPHLNGTRLSCVMGRLRLCAI
jgi:hypothetical protein